MRRVLIVLAVLAAATAGAQIPSGCTHSRAACELFDAYLAALNARDWNAFHATFDDSITVLFDAPAPPERVDGRAAVEALFRPLFVPGHSDPPQFRPDALLAQDFGDVVVISFLLRGNREVGRRTVVLHRDAGRWRVVHIHASSRPPSR